MDFAALLHCINYVKVDAPIWRGTLYYPRSCHDSSLLRWSSTDRVMCLKVAKS